MSGTEPLGHTAARGYIGPQHPAPGLAETLRFHLRAFNTIW